MFYINSMELMELTMKNGFSSRVIFACLAVFFFIAGCSTKDTEPELPKNVDTLIREFTKHLFDKDKDTDYLKSIEDKIGMDKMQMKSLVVLSSIFRLMIGEKFEIEFVSCRKTGKTDKSEYTSYHQIRGKTAYIIIQSVVMVNDGKIKLKKFQPSPVRKNLKENPLFPYVATGLVPYFVIGLYIPAVCFMLYALVICVRSRISRKWLWIIIIIIGMARLNLDLLVGTFRLDLLDMKPIISFVRFIKLWLSSTLSIAIPYGAFIFLFFRHKLTLNDAAQPVKDDDGSSAESEVIISDKDE